MATDNDISMFMDELSTKKSKFSPLYTSPRDEELKRNFIKEHGVDRDGAYRVHRRIDGKK